MPSARADEFRRVASRLGFTKLRQTGSHERWGPIHGGREIGPPLYNKILDQLQITAEQFRPLK